MEGEGGVLASAEAGGGGRIMGRRKESQCIENQMAIFSCFEAGGGSVRAWSWSE